MANKRLSFIFKAGSVGWSEQWYTVSSSGPVELTQFYRNPAWLSVFLGFRAMGVVYVGLRVNDVDVPRSGYLDLLNINCKDYSGPAGPGEEPAVCALGYCVTTNGNHRPVQMRGLPDGYVNRDPSDNAIMSGPLIDALNTFSDKAGVFGLGVKVQQLPHGNNQDRQLDAMAPAANDPNSTTFTYTDPIPLTKGQPVILHGISRKKWPGYQGVLPTQNVTPTTFDVPVIWRAPATQVALRQATVRNYEYAIEPVSFITWEDFRTKRLGRPILSPRGRRSGVMYRAH
jgi:hypothetical protein